MAKPFLATNISETHDLCLICHRSIRDNEKAQKIGEKGLDRFQALAQQWSTVNIPLQDEWHRYTDVYSRITSQSERENTLRVHTTCRVQFSTNIQRCISKYGFKIMGEKGLKEPEYESPNKGATWPVTNPLSSKRLCFVCNTERVSDKNQYNEGGLARCSTKDTADRLMARKEVFMKDKENRLFAAARRLEILLSGQAHDIFAMDLYYHQSCYIKFVHSPYTTKEGEAEENRKEKDALAAFLYRVKTKILRDKQAYLLNELLKDIEILSEEEGLNNPAITNTRTLKRYIIEHVREDVAFFPIGKYLIAGHAGNEMVGVQ